MTAGWQFWVDRGGTFTDLVAVDPDGRVHTHKLLSENPERYSDAPLQGIRDILRIPGHRPIPTEIIDSVKMGTTVGTNALLEHKGEPTALAVTRGFKDALRVAYQNRPDIFALEIHRPEMLYTQVVEIDERIDAQGNVVAPLNIAQAKDVLMQLKRRGLDALAVVLMHAYRFPEHEKQLARIAREIGFSQLSISHEVSGLMKFVGRGDTTMVDAYLSPILKRYVNNIAAELEGTRLFFMQSNGGLANAASFRGKDCILSGPAGGVVGAVATAGAAGFDRIIGFDMGGTSTDVFHYNGEYERTLESEVAGIRIRAPMLHIHTVAAGGGSIIRFDGARFRVGPDSAGANPGPACYRRGGPLTVTDCNVILGKLSPENFPKVFGANGNEGIDTHSVHAQFEILTKEINAATGAGFTPQQVAQGFIDVAVEGMAAAIKRISVERGYDVSSYTLACFGGAGGQHACRVADALGIKRIFIHQNASVLSAYGIGLADVRVIETKTVELELSADVLNDLEETFEQLMRDGQSALRAQGIDEPVGAVQRLSQIRYQGTDTALAVEHTTDARELGQRFTAVHQQRFGFIDETRGQVIESVSVEMIVPMQTPLLIADLESGVARGTAREKKIFCDGRFHSSEVMDRLRMPASRWMQGPALITEPNSSSMVEPGWRGKLDATGQLIMERHQRRSRSAIDSASRDPVVLEIFNKLFMSVAEQMGHTLQNTSYSVNMKERLDFSCAVFSSAGALVSNAPHMPVHLGSMGDTVTSVISARQSDIRPGDVYIHNAPYRGGTHLPDITVISPVFNSRRDELIFYVASRGHHADIGGITPGSMPAHSVSVEEEGILIDNFLGVRDSRFRERELLAVLNSGPHPARNPLHNIADLKAQIAANTRGENELHRLVRQYGLDTVQAYMGHVQNNAEESVRRVIDVLGDGQFRCELDDGSWVQVAISINQKERAAVIDFSGTAPQQSSNFNAPAAVCRAAVLYVFRTLVADDIPLNAGCLQPLHIIIPRGSMLNPDYPAAVVAGNVETSQIVVDALYGALGTRAASQGTMNNFTFGNNTYQYYETICGGAGGGIDYPGTDAVHTHMTNSRLTDPEVLEWRFPVRVENFSIRENSGGAGVYPGGNGVIRRIRFCEPMTASILSNRRRTAPFGMRGGEPGRAGLNYVERRNGDTEPLGACDLAEMSPGDKFVIETPGGGGFWAQKKGR